MENNNVNVVFLGWKKVNFVEREDLTESITFSGDTLSFFKGAFSSYVANVEEIRTGIYCRENVREVLVNQMYIFHVTIGQYGYVEYVSTYSERHEKEQSFGQRILDLSRWADVPWHIAKIVKDKDMVKGYEILCSIKKVAETRRLSGTQQLFLREKDLKLRNCILESLFNKKVWDEINISVTQNEINSRYLAYYILVKGDITRDINVMCDVPKAYIPVSEADIFKHNLNLRAMKAGVGIDFALCTVDIEDNAEAIMFLRHMRNVIADTGVRKKDDWLFCSEDSYYRNSMIRHFFGEEIWATIGTAILNKTACSLAVGHYLYQYHRRGKG